MIHSVGHRVEIKVTPSTGNDPGYIRDYTYTVSEVVSEFTGHCTCSLVLNLVPGIVSGTKRDFTNTVRAVVS